MVPVQVHITFETQQDANIGSLLVQIVLTR